MTSNNNHITFASGVLMLPEFPGCNNRGVITDQMVPEHDHVEAYLFWRMLEPQRDQWDWRKVDEMIELMSTKCQKMLGAPWLNYAPKWFQNSDMYVPLKEMNTDNQVDLLSIWAPGTWWAYEHFYAQLAKRYPSLDIIKCSLPSSDFGEVGFPMGVADFTSGSGWGIFTQNKEAWHMGMWCGDEYALKSFRDAMKRKYHSLDRLNKAWHSRFNGWSELSMMRMEDRYQLPQRWLDLIEWYNQSQVEATHKALTICRKYFPHALLEVPLGYGCEMLQYGCDRTALCREIAQFGNTNVRSTHGAFNRWVVPAAYWFYKRMAPVTHKYGAGFGTEPPGGDLTPAEMKQQLFEDASAGCNLLFSYFQNWHVFPDVAQQWRTYCRPSERSLVSVAVIYPNTQMALDLAEYPMGQWELFDTLRSTVDMDVVDEHMISWGLIDKYKVLINTNGKTFPKDILDRLWTWLQKGGVFVTRGSAQLCDVDGRPWPIAELKMDQSVSVGRGRVVRFADTDIVSMSSAISQMLRQMASQRHDLYGVNPKQDGMLRTQFSDRWLSYDPVTGKSRWE